MITFLKFLTILMVMSMTKTLNPVKMSIIILILSSIIFMMMQENSKNIWYPTIFFLLFMGGILIMFMILSSLMPNQKSFKMKIKNMMFTLILISILNTTSQSTSAEPMIKWMMHANLNLEFLVALMLMYFLVFMSMINKEKMPLRSESCFK